MFFIDYKSRKPLYEQLVESIREQIINGQLEPDSKLPSVRELASNLTIHPNTIQKVYRQLETDGYVYSVRGRGNYVAKLGDDVIESQIKETYESLEKLVKKAVDLGINDEEFIKKVKDLQKDMRR